MLVSEQHRLVLYYLALILSDGLKERRKEETVLK